MYIDNLTILDDARTLTAAGLVTSTYYIDMLAAGFSHNDELYVQFLVDTAFTITAAASLTVAVMIANETTFASTSLAALKAIQLNDFASSTTLAAGKVLATIHLGPDLFKQGSISGTDAPFRYLYVTYTPSVAMASGKIDCRLVKDIDMTMDKVL